MESWNRSRAVRGCLCVSGMFLVSFLSPHAAGAIGNLPVFPIQFERSGIQWVARGPGYQLTLDRGSAMLNLATGHNSDASVKMTIAGANPFPEAIPELPVTGQRNYLIGSDAAKWRTDVPLWQRVRFREVLEGVDLVFYGTGPRLEYDVV